MLFSRKVCRSRGLDPAVNPDGGGRLRGRAMKGIKNPSPVRVYLPTCLSCDLSGERTSRPQAKGLASFGRRLNKNAVLIRAPRFEPGSTDQISRLLTNFAFSSINNLRGSTSSPINLSKVSLASNASSTVT
jgi:hypothetical protein